MTRAVSVSERASYVGIAPCGCVRAASVDECDRKQEVARFCAEVVRDGLRLERWETERTRRAKWWCSTCDPKTAAIVEARRVQQITMTLDAAGTSFREVTE